MRVAPPTVGFGGYDTERIRKAASLKRPAKTETFETLGRGYAPAEHAAELALHRAHS